MTNELHDEIRAVLRKADLVGATLIRLDAVYPGRFEFDLQDGKVVIEGIRATHRFFDALIEQERPVAVP